MRKGLLFIQLGSPASDSVKDVKAYLRSFLSDPRLVKQSLGWKVLLNAIILPKRAPKVALKYRSILKEGEMPLHYYTRLFSESLTEKVSEHFQDVAYAYVHGKSPLVKEALQELQQKGVAELVVVPLYPQFAEAMTSSARDALDKGLRQLRWKPTLQFIEHFYESERYSDPLAHLIDRHVKSPMVEKLLFSFHGYPVDKINAGDPYYAHCLETVEKLKATMLFPAENCITCFQSKFGPGEWLTPATDDVIRTLREEGVKRIAVVSPSFVADNLETSEEIGMEYRDLFLSLGGEEFTLVPSLNNDAEWVDSFAEYLIQKVL